MTSYKFRSVVTVDFDRIPFVLGRVTKKEPIEIEGKARNTVIVDSPSGLYRVFETVGLADAFAAAAEGDGILIHFLEMKSLKKSGRKMRQMNAQVFEWPSDGVLPPELRAYGDDAGRVAVYTPPTPPPAAAGR